MNEYYKQVYDVPTLLEEPVVSMTLEDHKEDDAFLLMNYGTAQRPHHHRQLDDLCEAITTRENQEKSHNFIHRHSGSTLFHYDNDPSTTNENRPPSIPVPRSFKLSSQATPMADGHQNDMSANQLLSDFWGSSGSIHSVSRAPNASSPQSLRFANENHHNMASIPTQEQTNGRSFIGAEGAGPGGFFPMVPNNTSFQYPQPNFRPHFYAHGPFIDPRANQADAHPNQQIHATAVHPPMVVQTDFGPAVLLCRTGAPSIPLTAKAMESPDHPHQLGQVNPPPTSSVKTDNQSDPSPSGKTAKAPEIKGKSTRFRRWSEDEDELLLKAAKQEPGPPYNWNRISTKFFPRTRTGPQCKARWKKALKPGMKRGQWEPEEDRLILELAEKGLKWTAIAEQMPGRVPDHIHQRFMNSLDPTKKKTPWSEDENNVLYEAQKKFGNKWSQIAKLLPGRSDNDVKNRWHNAKMAQRRKMRRSAKENDRLSLIMKDVPASAPDTIDPSPL